MVDRFHALCASPGKRSEIRAWQRLTQLLERALHGVAVRVYRTPPGIGKLHHRARLFPDKILLDANIACLFELGHMRGEVTPGKLGRVK